MNVTLQSEVVNGIYLIKIVNRNNPADWRWADEQTAKLATDPEAARNWLALKELIRKTTAP